MTQTLSKDVLIKIFDQNLIEDNNLFELAKELDYKAVDALVFTDNLNIIRLLLSFEFLPVNILHHVRADGIDLMSMKKYL